MGDGLAIALGVLQVAELGASVGSTLYKCAKKFRHATEEFESIARQVGATQLALRSVHDLLNDPATQALHSQKLYDDTTNVSEGCRDLFQKLNTMVRTSSTASFLTKVRWLSKCGDIAELGKALRHYTNMLDLMMSAMMIRQGAYVYCKSKTDNKEQAKENYRTKSDMQALDARYKTLEISYGKLSESNRKLVDAHVALTQTLCATTSGSLSSAATKPGSPQLSTQPMVTDSVTCHLQRCMDSVQELTRTITCAINAWHGHVKTGSSDLRGSYAMVTTAFKQISTHLQCSQCTGYVAWSHFDPARPELGGCGTCTCKAPSWRTLNDSQLSTIAMTDVDTTTIRARSRSYSAASSTMRTTTPQPCTSGPHTYALPHQSTSGSSPDVAWQATDENYVYIEPALPCDAIRARRDAFNSNYRPKPQAVPPDLRVAGSTAGSSAKPQQPFQEPPIQSTVRYTDKDDSDLNHWVQGAYTVSDRTHYSSLTPVGQSTSRRRRASQPRLSLEDRLRCRHEGCDKVFASKSARDHHSRWYGPKVKLCMICGKGFVSSKDLKRHEKVHKPSEHDFFCEVDRCHYSSRGFARKDHLPRHLTTHEAKTSTQKRETPEVATSQPRNLSRTHSNAFAQRSQSSTLVPPLSAGGALNNSAFAMGHDLSDGPWSDSYMHDTIFAGRLVSPMTHLSSRQICLADKVPHSDIPEDECALGNVPTDLSAAHALLKRWTNDAHSATVLEDIVHSI